MALGKCRECGTEVSSEAKTCPKCGIKKPVKQTSRLTWALGALFAIAVFGAVKSSADKPAPVPKTSEQLAAAALKEKTFQKTVVFASSLKKAMRDPDSLVWESISASDDGGVMCAEYRAKNGFGGYSKEFAVYAKSKVSQKPADWNKYCTQPLNDMMSVRYAMP